MTDLIPWIAVILGIALATIVAVRWRSATPPLQFKVQLLDNEVSRSLLTSFGKEAPGSVEEVLAHSDRCDNAQDLHGIQHQVYFKDAKLVAIHLRDVPRIVPSFRQQPLESVQMPVIKGIMLGDPPAPAMSLTFSESSPCKEEICALAPNVLLVFQSGELKSLRITEAATMLPGMS